MAQVTSDTDSNQPSFPQELSFHSSFERKYVHGPSEYNLIVNANILISITNTLSHLIY